MLELSTVIAILVLGFGVGSILFGYLEQEGEVICGGSIFCTLGGVVLAICVSKYPIVIDKHLSTQHKSEDMILLSIHKSSKYDMDASRQELLDLYTIESDPEVSHLCSMNIGFKNDKVSRRYTRALNALHGDFKQHCSGGEVAESEAVDEVENTPPVAPEAELVVNTVTGADNVKVLSPQMYKELIEAAKTCRRVEDLLLQRDPNTLITEAEYAVMTTAIAKCQAYQLEGIINGK